MENRRARDPNKKKRHTISKPNTTTRTSLVALDPNRYPAPRGESAHPVMSSGSDHMRSQYAPWWGISWALSRTWIWSIDPNAGDNPPWTHKTLPSISYKESIVRREGGERYLDTYCRKIEIVKYFHTIFPWIGISIFPHAFLVKSINLCNLPWFMIST